MKEEKYLKVKLEVEGKKRTILFRPVFEKELGENRDICLRTDICPYANGLLCRLLKNPAKMNEEDSTFMDLCSNLEDYTRDKDKERVTHPDDDVVAYVPIEGTLEENLSDVDNYVQTLIKDRGYVKIGDVIDNICSDGLCGMYDPSHCNCDSTNEMCLLRSLLVKKC